MARAKHRWRLLLVPSRSGAENMARDRGLMDRARETGECVFSVYGWDQPTLSLGRNQAAANRYDLDEVRARGVAIVRRPTGGRALLHHHEVTYSVTSPVSANQPIIGEYRRINLLILEALKRLGVAAAEARNDAPTPQPGGLPCFAVPANGELVTGGAKLVGSAQVREDGALLQHGSILIHDDQHVISALLVGGSHAGHLPAAATLTQALGRSPMPAEVAAALFDAVVHLEDTGALTIAEPEISRFTARHIDLYESERWTWRR